MLIRALFPAALLLFPAFSVAQDALQLLKRAEATLDGLPQTRYDFEMVEVRENAGAYHNITERRTRVAGSAGRYRSEQLPSGTLYVYDGQFKWAYNGDRNEYTKVRDEVSGKHVPSDLTLFQIYSGRARNARHVGKETLQLASGPVACDVIEVEQPSGNESMQYSPWRYWIDASRGLALKARYSATMTSAEYPQPSTTAVTLYLDKATIGGPVEDALFRFDPPEKAIQVQRLTFGPKSKLVGSKSPDFVLTDGDGTKITSASLRGKAVLLSFSASPGGDSLPVFEMAYRAFKGSGLNAFLVARLPMNPAAPARVTIPVALDPSGSAAKLFGFDRDGTVLIDGSGTIVYANSRRDSWPEFARALQTTGLW